MLKAYIGLRYNPLVDTEFEPNPFQLLVECVKTTEPPT